MFQKLFHQILGRRHFWRHATFGEVAELYISRMLRLSAVNIVAAFMSIYLFQVGYSISEIALFWAAFYVFKAIVSFPATRLVGKIGPKHATLIANVVYIPASIAFALLPTYGPVLLPVIIALQGFSISLYTIAYNVDFSKVKNADHAGKEIAYMHIIERLTVGASPLVGGAVAYFAGPQATIILSSVLFAFAAAPLLRTAEQVKTGVKLNFKGFPWQLYFTQAPAQWAFGFDVATNGNVWSLFVAITVIGIGTGNDVYLVTGILSSVVFLVAIVASYTYGKIIDHKHGGSLMRAGAVAVVLTHLVRPFTGTTVGVAGLNATNEMATTAYSLPYIRGMFDNADLSGYRREYLGLIEAVSNIGAACAMLALAAMATFLDGEAALTNFFFVAAAASLLLLTARFPLYKR